MTRQPIPVLVLAGFLGSGKTTLLNSLLHTSNGARIAVIINDFGRINIDALSVTGQTDAVLSLSNGCVCCVNDTDELANMLAKLARPSAQLDAIVIEASGLAEPTTLIRLLLMNSNKKIVYGGLIEVVDAVEFVNTKQQHTQLAQHIRCADMIVLNKIDRVSQRQVDDLIDALRNINPEAPIIPTSYGKIPPTLLFDRVYNPHDEVTKAKQLSLADLLNSVDTADEHMHAKYQSVEFSTSSPIHPTRLLEFLSRRPAGIFRLKGFVFFDLPNYRHKFIVHTVGSYLRVQRTHWRQAESRITQLVAIGTGLDRVGIKQQLAQCIRDPAEQVNPHAMLRILAALDSSS